MPGRQSEFQSAALAGYDAFNAMILLQFAGNRLQSQSFAVDQGDKGGGLETSGPVDELGLTGMSGEAAEGGDFGFNCELIAEHSYSALAVDKQAPEAALGLEADEENSIA